MEIKNKTILLVEDEKITAIMTRKVLENHGFKVIHAYTGEDAVESVDSNPDIDLILMDIDLGDGIYGTEAAEQILSRHDMPLVFLSSHTEHEIVNKTKSITNYGYVVKNTGEVVLIAAIEMALKLFESNRAIRTHLSQQEHLVAILFELHRKMYIPFNELMDFAIESSVKLTMCDFAFGGLLNEDESLMTIHAWSAGAMESCSIDKNPIHFPIAEAGVWSECVRQRKPVLINDYAGHPAGKGYPSGHVHIVNFMAVPIFDGERIAAVGAVANRNIPFDVSDVQVLTSLYQRLWEIIKRKGLEDTLYENVDILTKSQEMAHIGNWFLDVENNHLFWSDEVYRIFGFKPREFAATYEAFLESVHPDDREKVHGAYSESLANKRNIYEVEHRIVQKNSGNIRYVFEKCFHEYNKEGDAIRSTGIVQDITELKQSEFDISKKLNQIYTLNQELEASNEELEQSNKLLQQTIARMNSLLDNTPAFISIFDENGKYIEVSNTFAEQLGLTRNEIKGKTFSDLLPGETVNEFMKTIEKLQDGNKPLLKTDTIYINGEKKVYESRLFPISNENENTSLFGSIAIDITGRKQADKNINMLLKESHHRVKNNMNTIYGLLMLQAEKDENAASNSILINAAGQLHSMIIMYDKLYRSSEYSNINIQDYLNRLIDEIVGLFSIHIPVETEISIEDFVLSVDIVSPLSIIINELITNSMKYAFTGKDKGKITISATKKDNLVTLAYSDNGIGLPESFSIEESDTFGMQLVNMLVKQIKGSLKTEKGDGVRFVIEFNLS